MRRTKKLGILLGVLAALGAATLAVVRTEQRKEQIAAVGDTILALESASVESVAWEYEDTSLTFHKDGDWLYDADPSFPVSADRIDALLAPFENLAAAFVITDVEDLAQYGLKEPLCTITLSAAGQTYTVTLGDYSQLDAERYLSLGDGNVYLVSQDPLQAFDVTLSDLIEDDEIPDFDEVTGLAFLGLENYAITCMPEGAASYSDADVYFTQQDSLPLSTTRVDNYLQSLSSLEFLNYVTYNATSETLSLYGLDTPALTVTVSQAGGADFVLQVGRNPTQAQEVSEDPTLACPAYVRVGESPIVYEIAAASYQKLTAVAYDDLRHAEVVWMDFADVTQLDITLEDETVTLTRRQADETDETDATGESWLYQDGEVDISALQSALLSLSASEFTDEAPKQKQEIGLTLHLANASFPQVEVALYRYDATYCLAVVDGQSVSLVARTAVVDLIEAVHAITLQPAA